MRILIFIMLLFLIPSCRSADVSGVSPPEDFQPAIEQAEKFLQSGAITFGGANPGRIRFHGCYINSASGSAALISLTNTGLSVQAGTTKTGTIAVSGTAVTGTGTLFTTEFTVGDYVLLGSAGAAKILTIVSNTSMVIDQSFTVAAGATIKKINSPSLSTVYFERCNIDAGSSSTRTQLSMPSTSIYLKIRNTEFSGGTKSLDIGAGVMDASYSNFECNQVNEVIRLNGGNSYFGVCSIKNTTANGSGILMSGATTTCSFGASGFAVNAGTGYCVRGTGIFVYDRLSFSHTALLAQNVKFQNTLTLVTYTTVASVVA